MSALDFGLWKGSNQEDISVIEVSFLIITAMPAGRPLKFSSPEELDKKIAEYFALCEEKKEVPFITGLAVFLDCDRFISSLKTK